MSLVNKTAKEKRQFTIESKKRVREMKPMKIFGIPLCMDDMTRLLQKNHLNDNIINIYLQSLSKKYPGCYTHNSFFYQLSMKYTFAQISRWTKDVNLFTFNFILVPIHINENHWTLAIINVTTKKIEYYDSNGDTNVKCMEHLLNYIRAEWYERTSSDFDTNAWICETVANVPQQTNDDDCGVFLCQFAKMIVSGGDVNQVNQKDINYYRNEIISDFFELMH